MESNTKIVYEINCRKMMKCMQKLKKKCITRTEVASDLPRIAGKQTAFTILWHEKVNKKSKN